MPAAHGGIEASHKQRRVGARRRPSGTIDPARAAVFSRMPNIHQQKKRVRIAERQHAENVRYRSTVRTLTRKLRDVSAEGGKDAVRPRIAISSGGSTAPSRAVRCTGTPPPAARRER